MNEMRDEAADLPPPTPEMVLLRVLLEAHLATLSPRKAARYLREVRDRIELERTVTTIRPRSQGDALALARALASRWWEAYAERLARRL